MKAARKLRQLQQPRSLMGYVRQFLTPQVWKQARQAVPKDRSNPRWDLQPLVLILLAMTWTSGDSEAERFQTARGFYVMSYEARKRPGKTVQGFQKALSRVPMRVLRALAEGVRQQITLRFAERLLVNGFVPMGCDGSRIECPRSSELEARIRLAGKTDSAPTVWVTAFVHLGTGLLWSWRLGPGTADERWHLRQLLPTLSPLALVVADAAYMGYELALAIVASERSFLLRMSSKVYLYTIEQTALETWTEGPVYYWPVKVREKNKPPLLCRLIRVPAKGKAKHDVWLLTNIVDSTRLSQATAAKFYRWRWKNEGVFRTYKRTINKVKLSSRTVRLVHREAEVSLLALQILLAHADLVLRSGQTDGAPVFSPRKVLIEIRQELHGKASQRKKSYHTRLETCQVKPRYQKSPKASREWPRRTPHKPPAPPIILTLDEQQKASLHQHLDFAGPPMRY